MKIKRCVISKYDASITEPPFLTIPIDECIVDVPEWDEGGVIFADNLKAACTAKGHTFKFYTMSEKENYDFDIVVYGEMEANEKPEQNPYKLMMQSRTEMYADMFSNEIRIKAKIENENKRKTS